MTQAVRTFLVTAAVAVLVALPLLAGPPRPVGTWTRDAAPLKVSVTFTETTMTARATFDEGGGADTITLDAEYSVTSDGVLYGVVTGVDARPLELAADLQAIAGQPFAARCRVDGAVMLVREVRFLGTGAVGKGATHEFDDIVRTVAGRYEASEPAARAAAPVVAPRALPPSATVADLPAAIVAQWEKDTGVRPARTSGMTLPDPSYLRQYPQYIPAGASVPLPRKADSPPTREVAPAPRPCGTH